MLDAYGNEIERNQNQQGRKAANESRKYGCGYAEAEGHHRAGQGRHGEEEASEEVRAVSVSQLRRLAGAELSEKTEEALANADWVWPYTGERGTA
jgi:hypothetical protein